MKKIKNQSILQTLLTFVLILAFGLSFTLMLIEFAKDNKLPFMTLPSIVLLAFILLRLDNKKKKRPAGVTAAGKDI